jgi:NACHT domain
MDSKLDGMGGNIQHVYENIGMLFFMSLCLSPRSNGQVTDIFAVSKEDEAILAKLKPLGDECGPQVSGCMEGTRLDILERINTWMTDFDAPNILWVKGHPGVGKSAISSSLVEQLGAEKRLGSRFFFQRQAATSMTTSALWRTVAYDLARRYPALRKHLLAALKEDEAIPATVDINKLFRQLIEEPIVASGEIPPERLPIVVIDALDECGGLDGQHSDARRSLMRTLGSWSRLPGRFKLVVTSRDESDIARVFSRTKHDPIKISAGQMVEAQSSQDIRTFVMNQLQERVLDQYDDALPSNWPGPQIVDDLVVKAAGLFIWAQTVVTFISKGEPQQRLNLVLKGSGTGDMNTLYSQILSTAFGGANNEEIDNLRRVLGTVTLAKEPLPFLSLRQLLSLEAPTVRHICNGLQSILESKDTLRFHHQSFVDFLIDPDRCPPIFLIRPKQESRSLTLACLKTMKRELKFNICHLESSYLRNNDIPDVDSRIKECIPLHVSYSCQFWARHLGETAFDTEILDCVEYFMSGQFLFWLEVLSLTKRVNIASSMLLLLVDWLKVSFQSFCALVPKGGN